MEQVDVLKEVAERLDALGLPWMLVGSHAATIHGHYRATHDIDIVVAYRASDVGALVAAFGDEYYIDGPMLVDGLQREMMSNLIHYDTAEKVDLWPLRDDEYDVLALERRLRTTYGDVSVWTASAEDTVLSKLRWARTSESEMQLNDVLGILGVQRSVDLGYLRYWAPRLGVSEQLEKLLAEAEVEGASADG